MELKRDSFVFYRSFFEAIKGLPKEDQCLMFGAIADYSLDQIEPNLTGINKVVWTLIKPQLDANTKRFINGEKGGKHGSKGGRPKKTKPETKVENPSGDITENPIGVIDENPKETPNVNANVNFNANDNLNANKNENELGNPVIPETLSQNEIEIPKPPKLNKEEEFNKRREEFKLQVKQFTEKYPYQMLSDFYSYWSEKKPNGYKMRFELEPVFEIDRRLKTWERKSKEFQKSELPANVGGGSMLKAL